MESIPQTPTTAAAIPLLDEKKLVFVLGNYPRWRMLRELASGETRTIWELAEAGDCSYHSAVKHLHLMRQTGLVVQGRGSLHQLPTEFLPASGQPHVDFGHCLLRFNAGE